MAYGAKTLEGPATLADIEALPEGVVGEIIDGTLYTHARPRAGHMDLMGALIEGLRGPFQRGQGGPGGWWVLVEPGIQVEGSPEFSPDLAGWRRERLATLPSGSCTIAPDWACEILSPSTRAYDQRIKRPFYARLGIRHLWFIDIEARTLTVSELRDGRWMEMGVYGEDDVIRAAPFDAIELRLGEWWSDIEAD
ncbi:Uma2 family endonuclease [Corallococcus praedator]|uniref:Uma2 family endonuclease n=1 Tax=Corallococcus praedator TaxID=2316724 RepID=A0ABX9QGT7_9BACT|nr:MULTISPECIES: Uma2 family endonuclease [Corallococcus]RKH12339.1 Uma2 family endonuclease [Corallococcus sp. CA047B]RKH27389.1 Uma2 family endonuclease [Corallococcus sp. CA031C]RKI05841.1 Uma2 family endonuclease [Corallococcus praedator]